MLFVLFVRAKVLSSAPFLFASRFLASRFSLLAMLQHLLSTLPRRLQSLKQCDKTAPSTKGALASRGGSGGCRVNSANRRGGY